MDQTPKDLIVQPQAAAVEDNGVEIDLLELFYHILDHWKLVVICVMVGVLAMAGYTKLMLKPTYEATSKMYVLSSSDSVVNLSDLQLGTYLASDYREVFATHEVTDKVISQLNLPYTYEQMQKKLSINNPSGTRILDIKVTSTDPQEAAAISNAYLEVASQYVADVMMTDKPTALSVALVPDKPVGPSLFKNVFIGALLGGLLSCGFLVVRFLMDDKVKSGEDITKLTGLPILAEIPVFSLELKPENKRLTSGTGRKNAL